MIPWQGLNTTIVRDRAVRDALTTIDIFNRDLASRVAALAVSGGSGGGASTSAPYVTIGNIAGLSAERALAVSAPITMSDGGANSSVTIGATLVTPAILLSNIAASGVATTLIRSDATIAAFDATLPHDLDGAAAVGTAAFAARRDHVHLVKAIRESGGPTILTMGAVPDGQFLVRSGSTVVGSAGSGASFATPTITYGTTYGAGILGTVIRSDAQLKYPKAIMSDANSSTFILTDDGTDQFLTGSFGSFQLRSSGTYPYLYFLTDGTLQTGLVGGAATQQFTSSVFGTTDVFVRCYAPTSAAYAVFEGYGSAGAIITTNTAVPISMRPNRVRVAEFGSVDTVLKLLQLNTGSTAGAHVNLDDKAGNPPSPSTGDLWRNADALNFRKGLSTLDLALRPIPIADGGTGQINATAAFNALDPLTTKGDVVVHDGTNSVRLAVGSNTQVLTADSAQATGVKWAAAGAGSVDIKAATITAPYDSYDYSEVVTDAAVTGSSQILMGWGATTVDDENTPDMEDISFQAIPGTGQFTAVITASNDNSFGGAFKLNYLVG